MAALYLCLFHSRVFELVTCCLRVDTRAKVLGSIAKHLVMCC